MSKNIDEKLLSFEDIDSENKDLENLNELTKYNYFPKDRDELKNLVNKLIKERGLNADLNDICTSQITSMSYMFSTSMFNGDISKWDVSNVENMAYMFYESDFNGDISNWDVSKVTDMGYMFYQSQFNGDISKWDVSNVTNMAYMFAITRAFNSDISKWDVSKVKNMTCMFGYSDFNGDISKWDVSNVETMSYMFYESDFNGNISDWNVSNVENMSDIFANSLFNGDISKWNINHNCNIYNANFPRKRKVNEKLLSFEDAETKDNDLENLNEITEIAERKKWLEEFKRPNSKGVAIHSFLEDYYLTSHHTEECEKYELYEDNKADKVYINKLNYKPLADETGEYIFNSASMWYYNGFGFFIEHRPSKFPPRNKENFMNFDGKLFFKKDIYTLKKVIYCTDDENIFVCFKPLKETNDYVVSQNGDIYRFLPRYNVYSLNSEHSTSKEFLSMFEKTSLNVSDEDFLHKLKLLEAKEMNEKLLSFEDTETKDNDLENLNNIDNVLERKKEFEKNWEYLGDDRYECNDLYRRVAKYKKLSGGSRIIETCNFLINNGSYELLFPLTDEYEFHSVTRFTYLGPKYNLYAARVSRIIKDENDPLRIRPKGGVAFFEYNIIFNDGTFLFPEWVSKYYILPDIAMDKIGETEEPFFNIRSSETGTTFRFYFNGDIVDISHHPPVKLPKDMTIEQYCRQKLNF